MMHYLWWRYHVRSQRAAMVLLAAPDFEFGRYADTLVNVVLAVGGWEQGERVKNDGFFFAPPVRTMMKHMKIKILQHQVHVMKSLIGGMLPLGQRYGVWYVPSVEFKDFCNEVTMFFFPGWLHHHWYNSRQWQCRQCRGGYTHWIFFMLAVSQAQFFTLLQWTLVNLGAAQRFHPSQRVFSRSHFASRAAWARFGRWQNDRWARPWSDVIRISSLKSDVWSGDF